MFSPIQSPTILCDAVTPVEHMLHALVQGIQDGPREVGKTHFYLPPCKLSGCQWVSLDVCQLFSWCRSEAAGEGGMSSWKRGGKVLVCAATPAILPLLSLVGWSPLRSSPEPPLTPCYLLWWGNQEVLA